MTKLVRLSEITGGAEAGGSDTLSRLQNGAISIGNFDGVHKGHRELLGKVCDAAERVGGPAIAIVLDPHPASVLRPHGAPPTLTTLPRRAELMSSVGIDFLLVCESTREFLNQTADAFFSSLVVDSLQAKAVVEGPNFYFGRDRTGNVARLAELCSARNIDFKVVEPSVRDERMVSSSRVREAIASGEITLANEMLGSIYRIAGIVASGERRGRTLGFPTANLDQVAEMLPGDGVFAGVATTSDGARHAAAIHIGPNPTFDETRKTKVEIHLLDYDGDLYGQSLMVELLGKVRGVQKFPDAAALVDQLHSDLQSVRAILPQSF
ncbi:bifunctional riboflavin kinase/FAD synthetase [Neorhodopirellula lusitana]|uniref:bifunctional riboflavin kinase/FAD synthetase n=1 Tax=Neorhodopirellula lusitana TaxID=445327 RepID=UPI00384C5B13